MKKSYKKELRKQLRIAIMAAIGFTIAFAWRETIFDTIHETVAQFTQTAQAQLSEVYTALLITLLGVFIIFITSRLLRD